MKLRLSVAVAMAFGLITLPGYFIFQPEIVRLRLLFSDWAAILAAVALVLGLANLIMVHWQKVVGQGRNWLSSIVLILALIITFALVLWQGPAGAGSRWILNYIQTPVESSLAALLSVILLTAGFRLLRNSGRPRVLSLIFIVVAILVLLGSGPLPGERTAFLEQFRAWLAQVPAVAGARGILLGVVLGIIATGLRVLMGADRPYSD